MRHTKLVATTNRIRTQDFEFNTIYLNVQDLFSEMLAHELAHAIVDNHLSVRPPRATAEILARYVGKHLNKKAKVY